MSVFLRWGIFGILGVAAMVYAYNASKRMAEVHSGREKPAVVVSPGESATPVAEQPVAATAPRLPPRCQAEFEVAQRALEARRQEEPIDRLLRIQEIAFQEQPRRARLELVARRWYEWQGAEPAPQALSDAVARDCESVSPAP